MFNSMFKSPENAFNYLEHMAGLYQVRKLCSIVLDDPRFKVWSGSSKPFQHHYGDHGLIIHTAEVVTLCLANNSLFYKKTNANEIEDGDLIDPKSLYLAALFHDAGKMWDYQRNTGDPDSVADLPWTGTLHKRRIHHISRSNMVWCETAIEHDLDNDLKDDISHAILAHHSLREWGSPVGPHTKLAWMLHLCDGISARMNDVNKWDQVK